MKTKEELIKALVENELTQWTEDDVPTLNQLEVPVLEKLQLVDNSCDMKEKEDEEDEEEVQNGKGKKSSMTKNSAEPDDDDSDDSDADDSDDESPTANSLEDFIAQSPFASELSEAVMVANDLRNSYVQDLVANERCEFSKDELNRMSLANLRRLKKLTGSTPKKEKTPAAPTNNSFAASFAPVNNGAEKKVSALPIPVIQFNNPLAKK